MNINLQISANDRQLDPEQAINQRQVVLSVSAIPPGVGESAIAVEQRAPLNLCLVLDHSGSMSGRPLETVKLAAQAIVDRLLPMDHLAIVAFDHRAEVLVANQPVNNPAEIRTKIQRLEPAGGTAIDEGMKVAIEELSAGKQGSISQALLLTDGENEHGSNERCLQLSQQAAQANFTLNTLGFGSHWNQDVLEQIADAARGRLSFIETPEMAVDSFLEVFEHIESICLTNAILTLDLAAGVRLADFKPLAQVEPDTIELSFVQEGGHCRVRLGDIAQNIPRTILANLYIENVAALSVGETPLVFTQVQYDYPALNQTRLLSERIPIAFRREPVYAPEPNQEVQQHVLALAKYRQTQIAESKLLEGDRAGAATMLQSAAQTALQMGDRTAATILQTNATRLQSGEELSEGDRKQTRMVSKTVLQSLKLKSTPKSEP